MKFFHVRFSLAQSLVALVVSFALLLSASVLSFASTRTSTARSLVVSKTTSSLTAASPSELKLITASATAIAGGVVLHWSTNSTPDNLGFNVYRVKDGERTRVNREIIPGALFGPGTPALMRAGYSYSWFDRGGTANTVYVIESVSVDGNAKSYQPLNAVTSKTASGSEQMPEALSAAEDVNIFHKSYPAAERLLNSPLGPVQEQWAIAGQTALKVSIRHDGWYRVTQQQMVAAGFNPAVDIRNLQLFVDGIEVAIATNHFTGPFSSGDYIEFYGRGLDTPTTDTSVYYLIAGTVPGKRVTGDLQLDSPPVDPKPKPTPLPRSTPPPAPTSAAVVPKSNQPVLGDPILTNSMVNLSWLMNTNEANSVLLQRRDELLDRSAAVASTAHQATLDYSNADRTEASPSYPLSEKLLEQPVRLDNPSRANAIVVTKTLPADATTYKVTTPAPQASLNQGGGTRQRATSRKKTRRKPRRQFRQEHSHVFVADGFAATNFDNTFQIKDRGVYVSNLINGEAENFFGAVISSPVTLNLSLPTPDSASAGNATLEFALQGVLNSSGTSHQVSVAFNGVTMGVVNFGPLDYLVSSFSIPASQVLNGANTIKFTKTSSGDVCIVDYVRMTYPHVFKADSGSLKFSLRGSQTRSVDGFAVPSIRLIDYTDPLAVKLFRPASEPTAAGYAITVPLSESGSKDQRLLLAIPEGQFDQPAALTLNQPSTLNSNSNAADFLIISHKDFIPSFSANVSPINTSLVAQRTAAGHTVSIVDIEDVYDEFSYGVHGPQAIKAFLQHASTNWATPPHYIIFAGDATLDPRNYTGTGYFDLVPTKLVDATYSETASDDWLADFDGDGIADIPVGRLPLRSVADANLVISKIVNFAPLATQSAMLVADDPTGYYFNFETANDQVQALLPAGMTVQRVNVRTEPSNAQAKADVVAGFNQGRALVNYTGHGNVDVWTGASIFTSSDGMALTNGSNLSFVVVMDCLNGYFQDPAVVSLSEAFLRAPNGGAFAVFASSGLTLPDGQHQMSQELYTLLYGAQPIAVGDAIKLAKNATVDIDVKRTWIFFGDPSMRIH